MNNRKDITGGLDLLGDWLDARGYTEEAGLILRAMDFIHKQGESLAGYQKDADEYLIRVDELNALRAENARLREATLEEAAKAAEGFPKNREWVPGSLYDTLRREVAQDIRRLK